MICSVISPCASSVSVFHPCSIRGFQLILGCGAVERRTEPQRHRVYGTALVFVVELQLHVNCVSQFGARRLADIAMQVKVKAPIANRHQIDAPRLRWLAIHATPDFISAYLSFFSRFPLMSNSCFWPPNSAAPFPLSLSPSIVSVYSTVISLSMSLRTAENVSVPSFSFRSLRFVSFWSGQLIVPASLFPSFLIVKVDVRFWSPISYSHFHVPTGTTLSAAPARPQTPSANAIERIAFMIASEKWGKESGLTQTATSR